ncbi:MAG: GSCFA domain-containing protein [Bacteroidaceae bacterium]|nr:GSCFA domain-containing protein [Bacteroidaceae bacterium]
MLKLNTPVEIEPLEKRFSYRDSILFIGSCFADEMGRRCEELYFDTLTNPFGVLFNPCSVAQCLGLLEGYGINSYGCSFVPEDVIETPDGYCSFHHHGSFCRSTPEEFLDDANRALAEGSKFYYRKGWVVVTLGTAFIYTDRESGQPVSNCHKLPQERFERTMIDVDRVYDMLSQYVAARPDRQWVFTVSPVRHLADGLHANQLSKATLHLGIEKLVSRYPNAHYFPAYEIMMDELRDYRFYADDMMHPSQLAANYIFGKFMEWALSDSDRPLLAEAENVRSMMQHRLLNPGTPQAAQFERRRDEALASLLKKIRS